jgi:hypothetical protein
MLHYAIAWATCWFTQMAVRLEMGLEKKWQRNIR